MAAERAYKMAGVSPRDVSFAEVHDCSTWTEISNTEDLGFCKKGEGGDLASEGCTALTGDIPLNPSGGLKSFGQRHRRQRGAHDLRVREATAGRGRPSAS
jgi:acetyl-CoA C-acetyltransferase